MMVMLIIDAFRHTIIDLLYVVTERKHVSFDGFVYEESHSVHIVIDFFTLVE